MPTTIPDAATHVSVRDGPLSEASRLLQISTLKRGGFFMCWRVLGGRVQRATPRATKSTLAVTMLHISALNATIRSSVPLLGTRSFLHPPFCSLGSE